MIGLVGTASPAHATGFGANDSVLINTARIDLIHPTELFSPNPSNGGELNWWPSAGTYSPRLLGLLRMDNAVGFCGKIRMEAFGWTGESLGLVESPPLCPGTTWGIGGMYLRLPALSQEALFKVQVSALLQFPPGSFAEHASVTPYP